MKRKIFIIIFIILCIITINLLYRIITNYILVQAYHQGKYSKAQAKRFITYNIPKGYIEYYNYGNILYQNGEYEEAINEYKKALKQAIPKEKECSIRINTALAICKTVQVDETSQESIKTAIDTYESAITILTEKGCANKENNGGHSPKAETLKKDIQKEIERLKSLQEKNKEQNDDEKEQEKQTEEKNENAVEKKMQEIKENAIKEDRENENFYKNLNKSYVPITKNW